MIFLCALIPIANLAVSLAHGGACAVLVIIETLFLLPLFAKTSLSKPVLALACLASVFLRACAILTEAKGALGDMRALIIVIACVAVSGVAAYNENSALYACTPLFFITALLAVYITAVSFGNAEFYNPAQPSALEAASAVVCPIASCGSVSVIGKYGAVGRIKGAVLGVFVCAVFLLFKSASAEFGFISVPLSACASALEIKAVTVIISKNREYNIHGDE